jgi:hypothetical protein
MRNWIMLNETTVPLIKLIAKVRGLDPEEMIVNVIEDWVAIEKEQEDIEKELEKCRIGN